MPMKGRSRPGNRVPRIRPFLAVYCLGLLLWNGTYGFANGAICGREPYISFFVSSMSVRLSSNLGHSLRSFRAIALNHHMCAGFDRFLHHRQLLFCIGFDEVLSMEAMKQYGKLYLTMILCFTAAAILAAALGGEAVSVSGEGSGNVIYLDPGHGGEDGGAVSVSGVQESELNLAISLRLRDLLQLCGMSTEMTRDGDYAIYSDGCQTIAQKKVSDLRNRVELLQQNPGAILVSIHQNQFPEEKYHGAQVFYNQGTNSETLASFMRDALKAGLDPENNREIKKAQDIFLMEQIENTAVLIECGFLSNREEEAKLRDEQYQKKIACAISAGLMNYIEDQSLL
ncbi:MAG: hypothetical protein E7464_02335 [Ruminococcaceae bacterium]|nr:hypothetical protein [Oscillospiraceae bacterium]